MYQSNCWKGYRGLSINYKIAGLFYRSKQVRDAFAEKSSSTLVLLRRDPANPHDPNAVAVYSALTMPGDNDYNWHKVGYVERHVSNSEFKNLPIDHVLEARKYGPDSFELTGKVRRYN